jgi:hypothetical protein
MGHNRRFDMVPDFGERDAVHRQLAGAKPQSLRQENDRAGEAKNGACETSLRLRPGKLIVEAYATEDERGAGQRAGQRLGFMLCVKWGTLGDQSQ